VDPAGHVNAVEIFLREHAAVHTEAVARSQSANVDRLKTFLPGRSRESALFWWGLNHALIHIGQVTMLLGTVKALAPS
jgi:hypothetical protein